MALDVSHAELLSRLAAEWRQRVRQGEQPELSEYTAKYPELADQIRDLFPDLVALELRPSTVPTSGGGIAPPNRAEPLQRLGDFRILRELGRGGMGIVYEAEQQSLGRRVALKLLPTEALLDMRLRHRFQREARAAARLHHTNIVPVFGVGEEGRLLYYVMQFIPGQGLDLVLAELRRLRRRGDKATPVPVAARAAAAPFSAVDVAYSLHAGQAATGTYLTDLAGSSDHPAASDAGVETGPAPESSPVAEGGPPAAGAGSASSLSLSGSGRHYWKAVARIGAQVADALDYAAGQGILHRDIKPSNLLLDPQGNVWVTDFGLAKATAGEEGLTDTGDIIGTLRYMAPERFEGSSDIRSDIYSLGLTLYELLVQQPAFTESDRSKLIHQVLHEEPVPPRRLEPAIPRDLETVVLKAIARDRAHRYQTAGGLAEDLKRFGEDRPIKARPVSALERLWRWARRNPALASLTAALVIALLAGLVFSTYFAIQAHQRAAEALADKQRADEEAARANEKAAEAEKNWNQARQAHAIGLLQQAQIAWRDSNVRQAGTLLQEVPTDLRGLEWNYLKRLYRGGILTLYAHAGAVSSVAFSPDGTRLATTSADWTTRIWDAHTGQELLVLKGHAGPVNAAAFSADGRRLATAGQDGTARVWDAGTGQELFTVRGHQGAIRSIAFSPDREQPRLATAGASGGDRTVRLWDVRTGQHLHTLSGHEAGITSVAFSPDGKLLASGSGDKTVRLWDTHTGEFLHLLQGHTGGVWGVAFSPDGQHVASSALDNTVQIWDVRTGREARKLQGPASTVFQAAFSPDGQRLASASADQTVRLWDVRTGRETGILQGHADRVWDVAFSPDGQRLATASADQTAKLWDVRGAQGALVLRGFPSGVGDVAFSPDGQRLATAAGIQRGDRGNPHLAGVGSTRIWDARTGQELLSLPGSTGPTLSVAFSPDGRRLATGSEDGTAKLWDAHSGQALRDFKGHTTRVRTVAFSPDGRRLATASWDGTTRIWGADTGRMLLSLPGKANRAAFSPDGLRLATVGWEESDRTATVWDAHSGEKLLTLDHPCGLFGLAFSPDGRHLATTSGDGKARIWDLGSGRQLFALQGHSSFLDGVAFSPDGHRLVATGFDGTVIVWETRTGKELLTLTGHTDPVHCVGFSPDGRRMATGSRDRTVRVWDIRPVVEPLALRGHVGPVNSVAYSPDGRCVATGSADGTLRMWDAATGQEILPTKEPTVQVESVAFSPNGAFLAGGGKDNTGKVGCVKVWDVRSGREHCTFPMAGWRGPLIFSPDSQRLVAVSGDGTAKVWDLRTQREIADPDARKLLRRPSEAARSPDGRFLARIEREVVYLHGLKQPPDAEELAYRQAMAQRDPVWQEEQAAGYELSGPWFAVAVHLDQALTARPDWPLHFRRGRARAELGRWAAAEADFAEAVRQEPNRMAAWRSLALTQLAQGREEAYRRTCGRCREQVAALDRLALAEVGCLAALRCPALLIGAAGFEVHQFSARAQVARLCALRPEAVADPAALLPWAADPITRGALLYRVGRVNEAMPLLRDRTEAVALLYRALVEQASAAPQEAKQHLEEAVRWLTAPSREDAKQTNADRLPWTERLTMNLLRGEAQAALAQSRPRPPAH